MGVLMARKKELKIPTPRQLPSGNWTIQLRLNGQSISITDSNYNTCLARARAVKAGILEHTSRVNITVGQAVTDYIDSKSAILSPSTIKAYRSYAANRFLALQACSVSGLTLQTIQRAVNKEMAADANTRCAKRVSAKTVVNAYHLIEAAIKDKVAFDLRNITLPRVDNDTGRALTTDEIRTLLLAIQGSYCEIPILLAVWLGLRRGEIVALKMSDFNFDQGTVSVTKALVQGPDKRWMERPPKTKASRRTIICDNYILDKVRQLPDDGGYIFKMHPNSIYNELQKICKRTGIPHTRLHDLRHTSASVGLLLNVPAKYMQERGGWSSPAVMSKVYQHTLSAETRIISERFNDFFTELMTQNANVIADDIKKV